MAGFLTRLPWMRARLGDRDALGFPAEEGVGVSADSRPSTRWYHAASAGELEILWPLILEEGKRGKRVVATVFSPSDPGALKRLVGEWQASGLDPARLVTGFSPVEGSWLYALGSQQPEVFVTAKYEAWPELWASLWQRQIPLVIVSARRRSSIDWALRLTGLMGGATPDALLLASNEDDASELRRSYPGFAVESPGDPRWERVEARAQRGNPRARELVERFAGFPRPWGVFGSVWPEDLEVWSKTLSSDRARAPGSSMGTFWVVPHRVEPERIRSIRLRLEVVGFSVIQSSELKTATPSGDPGPGERRSVLLIDEVGFLSELYGSADWAYVGGGFGSDGVHSVIEPAIHGLPIACGPSRSVYFPEIAELKRLGQLALLQGEADLDSWLREAPRVEPAQRELWRRAALGRLGATARILLAVDARVQKSGTAVEGSTGPAGYSMR